MVHTKMELSHTHKYLGIIDTKACGYGELEACQ